MKFKKEQLNLDKAMRVLGLQFKPGAEPFIKYDPDLKPQYRIIRQHSHDGLLMYTRQLLSDAMGPLLDQTSFFKSEPPADGMTPIYTIGKIRLVTVFGRVKFHAGEYPGQRERVTIPVSVKWVSPGRAV